MRHILSCTYLLQYVVSVYSVEKCVLYIYISIFLLVVVKILWVVFTFGVQCILALS